MRDDMFLNENHIITHNSLMTDLFLLQCGLTMLRVRQALRVVSLFRKPLYVIFVLLLNITKIPS